MRKEIVKSKVKCRRCKSNEHIILIELWKNATIEWEQINGEFDIKDGSLNPGDPYKVEAICKKCNYAWTLKGINQINHVII